MRTFKEVIESHRQVYNNSCIPSGVEIILKILGRVDLDCYDLQEEWGNRTDGSFADFHERELFGVRFRRRYFDSHRGPGFPLDELFRTISDELSNGRYVLISLTSPSGWHIYIVVEEIDDEFLSISKKGPGTSENLYMWHTREMVRKMEGTDVLTYEVTPEKHIFGRCLCEKTILFNPGMD